MRRIITCRERSEAEVTNPRHNTNRETRGQHKSDTYTNTTYTRFTTSQWKFPANGNIYIYISTYHVTHPWLSCCIRSCGPTLHRVSTVHCGHQLPAVWPLSGRQGTIVTGRANIVVILCRGVGCPLITRLPWHQPPSHIPIISHLICKTRTR